MGRDSTTLKHLREISKSEKFDELESYRDSKKWKKMNSSERAIFAQLLVLQGKQELVEKDPRVIKTFDLSLKGFSNLVIA